MKKIIIILALVAAGGAYYYGANTYKGEMEMPVPIVNASGAVEKEIGVQVLENKQNNQSEIQENQNEDNGKITVAELAKHNSPDDCWVVYKGAAYDITKFLPIHPGGVEKIAQFCGTANFQKTFEKKHGVAQSGEKFEKRIEKGLLLQQGEV